MMQTYSEIDDNFVTPTDVRPS